MFNESLSQVAVIGRTEWFYCAACSLPFVYDILIQIYNVADCGENEHVESKKAILIFCSLHSEKKNLSTFFFKIWRISCHAITLYYLKTVYTEKSFILQVCVKESLNS